MNNKAKDMGKRHIQKSNEALALADILAWSNSCPKWQRDALRRLCAKEHLDEEDIDELTALCKNVGKGGVPLGVGHIPDSNAANVAVALRAIHSTQNINALKEGERLTFAKSGLTIVYGDNGSGKSGYARVLKKVCRARTSPKENTIFPNIYSMITGSQTAVIDFRANGHNKSETWNAEEPSDPILSSISVFDCHTANVHVDEYNDVAYTPFPMRMLEQLAKICQEVKKIINKQITDLESKTPHTIAEPQCDHNTSVGRLFAELSGQTSDKEVRHLATLDETERDRLGTLRVDLSKDPARASRRVIGLSRRLADIQAKFKALQLAISDSKVADLASLHRECRTAQEAASVAADDLFASEPLPDVGSDIWRAVWEAARRYSEMHAYPSETFPIVERGARCVLCQQELDSESADRLVRFEQFVKDETKQKEKEAAEAYHNALTEVRGADVSVKDLRAASALIQDELGDGELSESVRRAALTQKWRLRAILRNSSSGFRPRPLPIAEAWPIDVVEDRISDLTERVAALNAEEESEERRILRAEYNELADREWLSTVLEDVIAEIGRRKRCDALRAVLNDTKTNRITTKSSQIAEELVTNALRSRFSKEIDRLDVSGLAIELQKEKSSYGVPRFRVRLIRKPDVRVGQILSEGEHRCVALAAFLAELATNDSQSAIVFDDPVSSLDHLNRGAVAKRLAEEGRQRQVIVLTHDIAFLFLLDEACRDTETAVAIRSVTRNDDYAGFVQKDPPARAQPIARVIEGLEKQLENERCFYDDGNQEKWERTVDAIQKRLRWTWERAVEEAVAPVVKRLSNKVETKGLAKLTTLTKNDCLEMRKAYGRCSTLLHSSAVGLNPRLPNPQVIKQEISVLRNWIVSVKQRQEEIDWLH